MPKKEVGKITKESVDKFLEAYLGLVKKVEELEREESDLHREILQAIDKKKMGKIMQRIQNTK